MCASVLQIIVRGRGFAHGFCVREASRPQISGRQYNQIVTNNFFAGRFFLTFTRIRNLSISSYRYMTDKGYSYSRAGVLRCALGGVGVCAVACCLVSSTAARPALRGKSCCVFERMLRGGAEGLRADLQVVFRKAAGNPGAFNWMTKFCRGLAVIVRQEAA